MLRFRHHAALAVLALACSKDASTGIAVAISAEARVPAELDTLEIVATRGAADTRFARTYRMPKDAMCRDARKPKPLRSIAPVDARVAPTE